MITQAWDRHRRDQLLISTGAKEVNEIMQVEWANDFQRFMNESFAVELQMLNPFVQEVFSDTEPIAKAAQRQGLVPGRTLTLSSGFDFRLQTDRGRMIKRQKPYVVVLAFPCGP